MATGRINKTNVDAAKAGAKDGLLWDDKLPGFGLKVTPKGAKVFIYQYRLGGRGSKIRRYTVGRFGKLTADQARKLAEGLALKVAQGIDPQREKVEQARRSVDLAFNAYVDRFNDGCLKVKWKATHKYVHALLLNYAVPILGDKPLTDIERKDIRAVLAPLKDRPATASNIFAVLRRLFGWAVNEGDIDQSPIMGMEPPVRPDSRKRVLEDEELALVWRASMKMEYPFGPFIRLLMVTGARRQEVAGLDWSELSHNKQLWSLPAERAKNDTESIVPLSDLAVAELDKLAKRSGHESGWPRRGLVFSTTGKTSISGYSRAKRRLDKLIAELVDKEEREPVEPWRIHDLRRTLATGLQRLGIRFEVTEAVLNHVSGSKSGVAGIYQRHDWGPEKVMALNAWSQHLSGVLTDTDKSNVVQLAEARA